MSRLRSLAAVLVLALSACAPGIDGLNQALANTASVIAVGYKTLRKVDVAVQDKIREQNKTDPRAAALALTAYLERYEVARKTLDAGAALVEVTLAAEPLIAKGLAKNKRPADYIADLIAVGLTVTAALSKLGVL